MESAAVAAPDEFPSDENIGQEARAPLAADSSSTVEDSPPPAPPGGGVSESNVTPLVAPDGKAPSSENEDKIVRYDFRHPSLLTPSEYRKLRLRHEDLARSLTTRFSIFLSMEFGFQIKNLATLPFGQFVQSLPTPSHFTIFKLDPFEGIGLWEMSGHLGLKIVDRMLGGPGEASDAEVELTVIDKSLLDLAGQILLKEWSEHVARQPDARASIVGHENNGRFLQFTPNDAHMIVLTMAVSMGETTEDVHLAFPYEMLQPVIRQLGPAVDVRPSASAPQPPPPPAWNPELGMVRLPVEAQWTGLQVTARRLAELKVGDVLPVEARYGDQVQVRLAKVSKFTGRLGKCGGNWAIELTGAVAK